MWLVLAFGLPVNSLCCVLMDKDMISQLWTGCLPFAAILSGYDGFLVLELKSKICSPTNCLPHGIYFRN